MSSGWIGDFPPDPRISITQTTGHFGWPTPHQGYAQVPVGGDGCRPLTALTEETIRKIIREELRLALAELKEESP